MTRATSRLAVLAAALVPCLAVPGAHAQIVASPRGATQSPGAAVPFPSNPPATVYQTPPATAYSTSPTPTYGQSRGGYRRSPRVIYPSHGYGYGYRDGASVREMAPQRPQHSGVSDWR
jgi:hypothetical protein